MDLSIEGRDNCNVLEFSPISPKLYVIGCPMELLSVSIDVVLYF